MNEARVLTFVSLLVGVMVVAAVVYTVVMFVGSAGLWWSSVSVVGLVGLWRLAGWLLARGVVR